MNNSRPQHRSIVLKGSPQARVYRTFEDWQAEQNADLRTPEQRGIHIGSPVMWRYRLNEVIITERAVVAAIDDRLLTLQVKDVESRMCSADISEIVDSQYGRSATSGVAPRPFIANQMETSTEKTTILSEDPRSTGSWL